VTRAELIEAVLAEMRRVWGDDGFGGTSVEYAWLLANYGITEEDDVQWQFVFQYDIDDMPEEDWEDDEVMEFVEDDAAVQPFLRMLLQKYRRGSSTYRPVRHSV
jgi:hypothetical protein